MKKTDCYFYFELYDMGAHIPCCTFKEYPLRKCPCDECTNYLPKKEASKIVREYLKNKNEIKNLSKRVEVLEKQIQEDKEEQLKKLKAELDYAKFHCALPTIMDMMCQ